MPRKTVLREHVLRFGDLKQFISARMRLFTYIWKNLFGEGSESLYNVYQILLVRICIRCTSCDDYLSLKHEIRYSGVRRKVEQNGHIISQDLLGFYHKLQLDYCFQVNTAAEASVSKFQANAAWMLFFFFLNGKCCLDVIHESFFSR